MDRKNTEMVHMLNLDTMFVLKMQQDLEQLLHCLVG